MDKEGEKEFQKWLRARNKPWEEQSALEATSADHAALGSTPPDRLADNPGKNLAELMSDEEIIDYLKRSERAIKTLKEKAPATGPQWEDVRDREITKMKVTLKFLGRIGKLPEEYRDFDVDTIETEK